MISLRGSSICSQCSSLSLTLFLCSHCMASVLCLFYSVNNKPEDAERALTMLTTAVAARVNLLIRNAHAVAKHGRPYTDFTWMATLDGRKGLDIGVTYLTPRYCKVFQHSIAEVERRKLGRPRDASSIPLPHDRRHDRCE